MSSRKTHQADGKKIRILEAPTIGRHVRKAGLDFKTGDAPFPAGHTLTTRDVALLAAMNLPWLSVHRKPRVAILSTGNELVLPGEAVGRNQIISSSGFAVAALVRGWGGDPTLFDIARDEHAIIGQAILAGAQHDVLITLGGGLGRRSRPGCRTSLKAQGLQHGFLAHRHASRQTTDVRRQGPRAGPRPAPAIRCRPWSARCCGSWKPAMERMLGQVGDLPVTTTARLAVDVKENDQREDYVRSFARRQPDGSLTVEPHKIQDSSMLSVLSRCNALMIRPPHDKARKAGETVQIIDLSVLPGGY